MSRPRVLESTTWFPASSSWDRALTYMGSLRMTTSETSERSAGLRLRAFAIALAVYPCTASM